MSNKPPTQSFIHRHRHHHRHSYLVYLGGELVGNSVRRVQIVRAQSNVGSDPSRRVDHRHGEISVGGVDAQDHEVFESLVQQRFLASKDVFGAVPYVVDAVVDVAAPDAMVLTVVVVGCR